MSAPSPKPTVSVTKAYKEDALALAQLIYDIYKEESGDKIEDGQNNAQENEN